MPLFTYSCKTSLNNCQLYEGLFTSQQRWKLTFLPNGLVSFKIYQPGRYSNSPNTALGKMYCFLNKAMRTVIRFLFLSKTNWKIILVSSVTAYNMVTVATIKHCPSLQHSLYCLPIHLFDRHKWSGSVPVSEFMLRFIEQFKSTSHWPTAQC